MTITEKTIPSKSVTYVALVWAFISQVYVMFTGFNLLFSADTGSKVLGVIVLLVGIEMTYCVWFVVFILTLQAREKK